MRWYADNSEIGGIRGAEIPDILMFGGIVVDLGAEAALRAAFEAVKSRHGHPRAPVKWNFKDLRRIYEKQNQKSLFNELLRSSKVWRQEIVEAIREFDIAIIVSCIESYSRERKNIKRMRDSLSGIAFSNGLMRYGLHVMEARPERAEVILDWPAKGNRKPFDLEYRCAYNLGKTLDGHTYNSGPLRDLGFHDSVMFTNMHHCSLLQLSDIVIGASREFVEFALGKREDCYSLNCFKLLLPKIRGYPNRIVSRGLSVSTGNAMLRNKIQAAVRKLVNRERLHK